MKLNTAVIAFFAIFSTFDVLASDAERQWVFSNVMAYQEVENTASALFTWAEAEYQEHENEGLFVRFPQDGKTIKATLDLAKVLKKRAAQVKATGDTAGSNALLFAAEATAYYATKMPHLLEDRINSQTQVANE